MSRLTKILFFRNKHLPKLIMSYPKSPLREMLTWDIYSWIKTIRNLQLFFGTGI
jgi:hypothetical protein